MIDPKDQARANNNTATQKIKIRNDRQNAGASRNSLGSGGGNNSGLARHGIDGNHPNQVKIENAIYYGNGGGTRKSHEQVLAEYDAGERSWQLPGIQDGPPPGGRPSGGRRYYGGGGVSSQKQKELFLQYMAAQLGAMEHRPEYDAGPAPVDLLTPHVNTTVDAAGVASAAAYDGVERLSDDPYANMQMRAARPSAAATAALVGSQGGQAGEYAGSQMAQREQEMADRASLWSDYKARASADAQKQNAAFNSGVEKSAAQSGADLETLRSQLLFAASQQHNNATTAYQQRQAEMKNKYAQEQSQLLMQLLAQGLQAGVDMSGTDIAKIMGGL